MSGTFSTFLSRRPPSAIVLLATRSTFARQIMQKLDVVGVLCVEFFVDARRATAGERACPRPTQFWGI